MNSTINAATRPHLTLLLGGVRSGKSAKALHLAQMYQHTGRVLFVATGESLDDEMRSRIDAHRAERPTRWETLEAPRDLAGDLQREIADQRDPYAVIVIDCLTLWVSNVLCDLTDDKDAEAELGRRTEHLLGVHARMAAHESSHEHFIRARQHWIVVSNEVGLGIVPPTPLGRRYRDALGRVNQLIAAAADDVTLMVAGIELPLKRITPRF
jgi:adenosylcobinamide kinase/adenosylcobinamide-phosphate guanylyltransferase